MEAVRSSKMSVKFYRTTRRHIPEDSALLIYKSCTYTFPCNGAPWGGGGLIYAYVVMIGWIHTSHWIQPQKVYVSKVFLLQLTPNKTADALIIVWLLQQLFYLIIELVASSKMLSCRKIVRASVVFYRSSYVPLQPSESAVIESRYSTTVRRQDNCGN
jgi:hypothetical protein